MSHYSTLANAENHPFRIAYKAFETEKNTCLSIMRANESLYKNYLDAESRLNRIKAEQQELLKIMPDDLTADLLVERLSKHV